MLVTAADSSVKSHPFSDFQDNTATDLENLKALTNARVLDSRLSPELVQEAVARMSAPCRILVSGPSSFNAAARSMLLEAKVGADAITVLEA